MRSERRFSSFTRDSTLFTSIFAFRASLFRPAFYFSFIATERADYNCKCYHKPGLTPARGEMNWHVGVKLRAESAGGPHDERRAPASVVNGPEE